MISRCIVLQAPAAVRRTRCASQSSSSGCVGRVALVAEVAASSGRCRGRSGTARCGWPSPAPSAGCPSTRSSRPAPSAGRCVFAPGGGGGIVGVGALEHRREARLDLRPVRAGVAADQHVRVGRRRPRARSRPAPCRRVVGLLAASRSSVPQLACTRLNRSSPSTRSPSLADQRRRGPPAVDVLAAGLAGEELLEVALASPRPAPCSSSCCRFARALRARCSYAARGSARLKRSAPRRSGRRCW